MQLGMSQEGCDTVLGDFCRVTWISKDRFWNMVKVESPRSSTRRFALYLN